MERLERHFDTAFSAPEGIKRLRELILTLAMQGKLLPQHPKDQPATELLEHIEEVRLRLAKTSKIKIPKSSSNSEQAPYVLPSTWQWVRLRDICHDWGQKTPEGPFTYIDVGSIDNQSGAIVDELQVLDASSAPSRARKVVRPGTVIFSTVRPYLLNIAVIEKEYLPEPIASTAFAILHPYEGVSSRFVYFYLRSPVFVEYVRRMMKGVAYPAINDGDFFNGLFPLPPIEEQLRIVSRIEKLMVRCDELEALSSSRNHKRSAAHSAALRVLLAARGQNRFAIALHFLAKNFADLCVTGQDVDELRKSILQLAVMGKLVPQDSDDPPASELLKTIESQNARLVQDGKIKPIKPLPAVRRDEVPYPLPHGWAWTRFDQLIDQRRPISYGVLVPGPDVEDGVPFVRIEDLQIKNPKTEPGKKISPEMAKGYERTRLSGGEILMGVVGSIGKIGLAPPSWRGAYIARAVCRIAPAEIVSKDYLLWILQGSLMQDGFRGDTRALAQPTLNIGLIRSSLTPLPPLPEQRRIAKKVDELMVLCDALEQKIDAAEKKKSELLDALMAHA